MAYTMEDFKKDYIRENLGELEPEEILEMLSVEERLKGLPAEERLKGLSPEVIEAYLKGLRKKQ